jgi:uncharacterized protein (TIGR00725 family)
MVSRRRPVLAVFGSRDPDTLEPAESVGREIASRGATLLTGGMRPGSDAVKERAIRGAESIGGHARWVGVPGKEAAAGDVVGTDTSLVVPLGYGDRRNCVEAHMCDAAIAFRGRHGTVSEVAFCLAFGRPVVLVGFEQRGTEFPVGDEPAARARYVQEAQWAVPMPASPVDGVDRLIATAYRVLSQPGIEQHVAHVAIDTPAREIVEAAWRAATGTGLRGQFPDLPERARAASVYRAWLDGLEPPVGQV